MDTDTTTKSSQPVSSSCVWRGALCSGDLDTSLDRECDEVIFNDDAGYCDCNGDGTKLSDTFECDDNREIFFCTDVCNSDDGDDSGSGSSDTPSSAPPEPSPVVTPAPSPPDSGGDLPVFEIPEIGTPCGDTCGSTLSVHTGNCNANYGHLIGECKCNLGWAGIDCKRASIRYRSTIFVKAFVPMRFSTQNPSDNAKRAFARTYLSLAASSLNLDRVENLEVLGLDKVYTKNNQIVIEFIVHEPLSYKQLTHMATRQEEAETIAQLADFAVSDKDGDGGNNDLFWGSRRVLLGVSSAADISITPTELKLSIDRQEPSKSKTQGEFIIRNTAVKGDELVINGIKFIGDNPWISIVNWKEGNEVRIPPGEASTFDVQADTTFFQDKKPNMYKVTLEFKHNVPTGEHAAQVSLNLVDTSYNDAGNGLDDMSEITADNVDDVLKSPIFLLGMLVGILLFIVCICFGFCGCKLCGCCRSRKAMLEGRGRSGSTPNRFQRVGSGGVNSVDNDEIELVDRAPGDRKNMKTSTASTGFSDSTQNNAGGKNSFGIDLTNNFSKNNTSVSAPVVANKSPQKRMENPALNFVSNPSLEPEEYERRWQRMDVTKLWGSTLSRALATSELEELLKKDHIYCMASGQKEDVSKFYFYAEQRLGSDSTTRLFMVECSVTNATKHIAFVFKTESSGDKNPMLYVESFISIVRNRIKFIVVD